MTGNNLCFILPIDQSLAGPGTVNQYLLRLNGKHPPTGENIIASKTRKSYSQTI